MQIENDSVREVYNGDLGIVTCLDMEAGDLVATFDRREGTYSFRPPRRRGDGRSFIKAREVAVVAAGNTSVVMGTADVRLPLESYPLQSVVSEPVKPVFPCVAMSNMVHAQISQSDKGELVIGSSW